jgi:hypothetical protein
LQRDDAVRGKTGGNRAELRFTTEGVHLSILSTGRQHVLQDISMPFLELSECRVQLKTRWIWPFLTALIGGLVTFSAGRPVREILPTLAVFAGATVAVTLVARLVPAVRVWIATPESRFGLRVSLFSRRRAERLVALVHRSRPDLSSGAA